MGSLPQLALLSLRQAIQHLPQQMYILALCMGALRLQGVMQPW